MPAKQTYETSCRTKTLAMTNYPNVGGIPRTTYVQLNTFTSMKRAIHGIPLRIRHLTEKVTSRGVTGSIEEFSYIRDCPKFKIKSSAS